MKFKVVNTVLSVDQDASPEMAAMLGASLLMCLSIFHLMDRLLG
ncbi:MAG: hypothetical protein ACLTAI_06515 [Thomasclavelia sp.]